MQIVHNPRWRFLMPAMDKPKLWMPGQDDCPYDLGNEHLLDPGIVARLGDNSCRALPATYQEIPGGPRIVIRGVYLFIGLDHVSTLSELPSNFPALVERVAWKLPEAQGMTKLVMTLSIGLGDVEAGLRVGSHLHFWGDFRVGEEGMPSQYQGAVSIKRKLNAG
jgi:hypothetical protein